MTIAEEKHLKAMLRGRQNFTRTQLILIRGMEKNRSEDQRYPKLKKKLPFMLLVAAEKKSKKTRTLSVRKDGEGDLAKFSFREFIAYFKWLLIR